MAVLELSLLGPFSAIHNDQPLNNFGTTKAQALLIYLAVEKTRPHRREHLFTLLWPRMPERSARHNLRQVLYALRKVIPDTSDFRNGEPIPLLLADRQTIQLNPDADVIIDIHQFDSLIHQSRYHDHPNLSKCNPCIQGLERAVTLYRGKFLTDFYLEDSNAFEDWAETIREKYRHELLGALHILTGIYINNQDYEKAQRYINQQFQVDNLRESSHRQHMEVLALDGRRLEALRHYQDYIQMLESEIGITPSQETTDFYERIRMEKFPKVSEQVALKPEELVITPHNLPQQLTPFIGREAELEDLDHFIADPEIRLITIVSPGGFGKTRLALACAELQLSKTIPIFPHGIYFISLDQLAKVDRLVISIADTINLQIEGDLPEGHSPNQQLLDFLKQKQILLLMDSFEHLLDGSELLVEILRSAPEVQILITSRERLNLSAEQIYTIGGLPYADWGTMEEAAGSPSAQLFLQSARRVQPDFDFFTGDDLASLAHICRDVEGIPLALVLSAVWVDMLSLDEIHNEIQRNLDFLEVELLDVPARHRGMRVVFDTTWERLNETERDVLRRFSVFKGGCNREAAQEVTGASLQNLAKLGNKSLIQYDQISRRYHIHELLRQFVAEKLTADLNDDIATQQAHCAYFCKALSQWDRKLKSNRQQVIVSEIEADYANLQVAWDWAVEKLNLQQMALAVPSLGEYHEITHRQVDAEMLFSKATGKIEASFGLQPEDADAALLLAHLLAQQVFKRRGAWGWSHRYGDEQASKVLLRSLILLKSSSLEQKDTTQVEAFIYLQLGRVSGIDNWREYLDKSLRLYEVSGDEVGMADVFYQIAANEWKSPESRKHLIRSLDLLYERGDPERITRSQIELGDITRSERKYDEAFQIYADAYATARSGKHPAGMAKARRQAAFLAWFLGQFDLALRYQEEGLALCRQAGNRTLEANFLTHIGVTEAYLGQFLQGISTIHEGVAVSSRPDPSQYRFLAFTQIHAGEFTAASQALYKSPGSAFKFRLQAWIDLAACEFKKALAFAGQSIPLYIKEYGSYELVSWSQAVLARALHGLGKVDEAKRELFQALDYCVETRAFLPLMHLIPVISVVMVDEEDQELKVRAVALYAMAESLPFVGNSKLFETISGRYVREASAHLPPELIKEAETRGQAFDWWERSEVLLEELKELGWGPVTPDPTE